MLSATLTKTFPSFLPLGPPNKPVGPLAAIEVHRDSATLEWKPPRDDGGAPITGYVIEKHEGSRLMWSRHAKTTDDSTTHIVQDLTTGSEYFFRVAAYNAVGTSEYLEMTRPVLVKSPYGESYPVLRNLFDVLFRITSVSRNVETKGKVFWK